MQRKLRVLIVTRLFSGLIQSVVRKKWDPTGIPAIFKIIEGLNRKEMDTDVLFFCKTVLESKDINNSETFILDHHAVNNLKFHVVPFRSTKIKSTKLNIVYNDFFQLIFFVKLILKREFDVVYCDRSNVFLGAVASLFFKRKVFLRLLGFYPDMKGLFSKFIFKLFSPLTYISYLAPYAGIHCTQDDSGGEYYLSKIPNRFAKKKLLLNGVDKKVSSEKELDGLRKKHHLRDDRPIILYVGKLERSKGCIEYLDTMLKISSAGCKFYAFIIGAGPLAEELKKLIRTYGLENVVKFVGSVGNDKIHHYYNLADIYVHLYLYASLTNTVLEAMSAGNALVLISPDKNMHVGEYTEEIIPQDCAIRFDRGNIVNDLSQKLEFLLNGNINIEILQEKINNIGPKILKTWENRIDEEINLITRNLN